MMKVVYPGSFDPITKGHLELIKRASSLFDEVVVLIVDNPSKHEMFTANERKALIETSIQTYSNVSVAVSHGLSVLAVKEVGGNAILRGIRNASDYALEELLASNNRNLAREIETILMIADPVTAFISSSAAKEVCLFGGELDGYVEEHVKEAMLTKKKSN